MEVPVGGGAVWRGVPPKKEREAYASLCLGYLGAYRD